MAFEGWEYPRPADTKYHNISVSTDYIKRPTSTQIRLSIVEYLQVSGMGFNVFVTYRPDGWVVEITNPVTLESLIIRPQQKEILTAGEKWQLKEVDCATQESS